MSGEKSSGIIDGYRWSVGRAYITDSGEWFVSIDGPNQRCIYGAHHDGKTPRELVEQFAAYMCRLFRNRKRG